jgi:hypothetical protein
MTIHQKIDYLFNKINWGASFLDAKAVRIMNELKADINLEYAAQQLTGFESARHDEDIDQLLQSMALTVEEWRMLKADGAILDVLSEKTVSEIDEYLN